MASKCQRKISATLVFRSIQLPNSHSLPIHCIHAKMHRLTLTPQTLLRNYVLFVLLRCVVFHLQSLLWFRNQNQFHSCTHTRKFKLREPNYIDVDFLPIWHRNSEFQSPFWFRNTIAIGCWVFVWDFQFQLFDEVHTLTSFRMLHHEL